MPNAIPAAPTPETTAAKTVRNWKRSVRGNGSAATSGVSWASRVWATKRNTARTDDWGGKSKLREVI